MRQVVAVGGGRWPGFEMSEGSAHSAGLIRRDFG